MNNFLVAAEGATAQTPQMSGLVMIIYIGALGLILYFMMIRPQKKQQKQMQALLSTLAVGDSVLTSSGFYGVVIDVMEEIVIVEFGNNKNCRIPMKKNSIIEIEKPNTEKNA